MIQTKMACSFLPVTLEIPMPHERFPYIAYKLFQTVKYKLYKPKVSIVVGSVCYKDIKKVTKLEPLECNPQKVLYITTSRPM